MSIVARKDGARGHEGRHRRNADANAGCEPKYWSEFSHGALSHRRSWAGALTALVIKKTGGGVYREINRKQCVFSVPFSPLSPASNRRAQAEKKSAGET